MTEQIERIAKRFENGASWKAVMLGVNGPICDKIAKNENLVSHKGFKNVSEITKKLVKLVLYRPYSRVCKRCRRCL